jgi:hypothetical protein
MKSSTEWRLENIIMVLLAISCTYIATKVLYFLSCGNFISYLSSGELSIFHGTIFFILIDLTNILMFFICFFSLAYLRFKVVMQDYVQNQYKRSLICDAFLIFCLINLAFFVVCIINIISKI